jgi:dethiobiotin synthetase
MANRGFITGTDTGVGKTVLTVLLTRHLREKGVRVRAVKPFCSGGREDAEALWTAQAGDLSLDAINPWHFRAPLAPLLAARKERRQVTLAEVVSFLRQSGRAHDVLLVEGAGGLLSPLGEGFSARELIAQTRAVPVIVCPNRLGAVNQARLVVEALPPSAAAQARIVLVGQARPDTSVPSNRLLLQEILGRNRVVELPWLRHPLTDSSHPEVTRCLRWLVAEMFPEATGQV